MTQEPVPETPTSDDPVRSRVKVWVPTPDGAAATEGLWAAPVAPGGFELDSIPLVAKGISLHDVVEAEVEDGLLTYRRVLVRGSHSTIHVLTRPAVEANVATRIIDHALTLGCGIERANERQFAISVSPSSDGSALIDVLEASFAADEIWYEIVNGEIGKDWRR